MNAINKLIEYRRRKTDAYKNLTHVPSNFKMIYILHSMKKKLISLMLQT